MNSQQNRNCQALTSALLEGSESTCRAAAYGLAASGPEAAHHVLRLLTPAFKKPWEFVSSWSFPWDVQQKPIIKDIKA